MHQVLYFHKLYHKILTKTRKELTEGILDKLQILSKHKYSSSTPKTNQPTKQPYILTEVLGKKRIKRRPNIIIIFNSCHYNK